MGGIGSHAPHPYAIQTIAFLCSLVLPGALFALIGGSIWERRSRAPRKLDRQVSGGPLLAADWSAD